MMFESSPESRKNWNGWKMISGGIADSMSPGHSQVIYLAQRFSTCGPRTTGGPRPSAWWSASKAWYFSLFTLNLAIGIKNRRNLFVFAYVSHCMTNTLFSNFIFISFGRSSKTLMKVKSTLDSPQIFDCRSKFLIDSRFWFGWLLIVYQFIVGLF